MSPSNAFLHGLPWHVDPKEDNDLERRLSLHSPSVLLSPPILGVNGRDREDVRCRGMASRLSFPLFWIAWL